MSEKTENNENSVEIENNGDFKEIENNENSKEIENNENSKEIENNENSKEILKKTFDLNVETELDEKDKKILEYEDSLKRMQAEFENFSKRIEREKIQIVEYSEMKVLKDFLPILDSFESAKKNAEKLEGEKGRELLEGINFLEKQFFHILLQYGINKIDSLGKKFDPELHECMLSGIDNEKDDGIILEEIQKGYLFKDKVLRHALVKVNKKQDTKGVNYNE